MSISVEQIDTPTAPESLLRELAVFYDVIQAENMPGDPPTPYENRIADWQNVLDHYPVDRWVLREDGEIVAAAVTAYNVEQNLENGFGRIAVHPEKRGRGYCRELAKPMFDRLESEGRHRFDTWIKEGHPAEGLADRLGLKSVYTDRLSRLVISELDRDLMKSWIQRSSERASDYELLWLTVPFPEEYIEPFCEMTFLMNTAPREDFEEEDEVLTPENWKEFERTILGSHCRLHTLIAVERSTGFYAGYTQIKTQDLEPDLAYQWDTGVHPDHRNKGLGRWLKAEMIEYIFDNYPQVTRVDTSNADSNEPMLAINEAMGFAPVHVSHVWQGDLATAREALGV